MEVFFQGAKQLILRRRAFWTSTLSVPRIPILASLRRVPHIRKSLTRQKALPISVANVHTPRTLGLSKRSMSTLHVP